MKITTVVCGIILIAISSLDAVPDEGDETLGMISSYGGLPLHFIENHRQVDDEVAYYMPGARTTLYFTRKGVTYALSHGKGEEKTRWSVKLDFIAANPDVEPKGENRRTAVFS